MQAFLAVVLCVSLGYFRKAFGGRGTVLLSVLFLQASQAPGLVLQALLAYVQVAVVDFLGGFPG